MLASPDLADGFVLQFSRKVMDRLDGHSQLFDNASREIGTRRIKCLSLELTTRTMMYTTDLLLPNEVTPELQQFVHNGLNIINDSRGREYKYVREFNLTKWVEKKALLYVF